MTNGSNCISVHSLKTKNNNKYLWVALCCEWLPSVHVAYNKCNIKIDVQTFMSWNEKQSPFTPHEKRPLGLKKLLSPGHFSLGPLGQTAHNRPHELDAVSLWRLLYPDCQIDPYFKRLSSTSWPEKAAGTPAQCVYICFSRLPFKSILSRGW